MPFTRDELGKIVRDEWVKFARQDPKSPPHHLLPFEELDEKNKEVDRRIGEAVVRAVIAKLRTSDIAESDPHEIHCGGCQGHA